MSSSTAKLIVSLFIDSGIGPCVIPRLVFMDNRDQYRSKFFETLRAFSGTEHLTATAYHLNTNRKADHCNITIVAIQQQNVIGHQLDSDKYVKPLT